MFCLWHHFHENVYTPISSCALGIQPVALPVQSKIINPNSSQNWKAFELIIHKQALCVVFYSTLHIYLQNTSWFTASEIWGAFTLGNTNIFVIFINISNFSYLKLSVTLQLSPVVNNRGTKRILKNKTISYRNLSCYIFTRKIKLVSLSWRTYIFSRWPSLQYNVYSSSCLKKENTPSFYFCKSEIYQLGKQIPVFFS